MNQIEEMSRQGLSVTAIAEVTGFDRKTVRKYLARSDLKPRYKRRSSQFEPVRVAPALILFASEPKNSSGGIMPCRAK